MKRSIGKIILTLAMSFMMLGFAGCFGLFDKDPSVTGTEVELAVYAISKASERNDKIMNNYAKSSVGSTSASSVLSKNQMITGAGDILSVNEIYTYFSALAQCNIVPAVIDYVVNSAGSVAYSNTFELNKTYFARNTEGGNSYIYYYEVEKDDNFTTCIMESMSEPIICQIEYDFENDKLISSKTIANGMFAYENYAKNEFSFAQFTSTKTLQQIVDGEVTYNDLIDSEYNKMYRGNIVSNINSIEFEEIELSSDVSSSILFNGYIKEFALGIDISNFFDKSTMTANNSFVDAMNYAVQKSMFNVRVNPENEFEYQYISTWIEFEDIVELLGKVANSNELNGNNTAKNLVNAYKNRLQDRGKGAYVGLNQYHNGNNHLSVTKVYDDVNAYVVSIVTGDNVIEFSCQLINNTLISKGDAYSNVEFEAVKSENGEYAVIERIEADSMIVNIPTEIEVDDEVLPVKALGEEYDCELESEVGVVINIPSTVEIINVTDWFDPVIKFNVDNNNSYFKAVNGVLYNKNQTELVKYPSESAVTEFTIPSTVTKLRSLAFINVQNLETLNVPSSLIEGLGNSFHIVPSLKYINVESGNSEYTSYDGIVYSADGLELLIVPEGRTGTVQIRSGTTTLNYRAIENCSQLTKVIFPDSLTIWGTTTWGDDGLLYLINCSKLQKIEVSSTNAGFTMDANGILYNKDKTILYFAPRNLTGDVVIPNTVERIFEYAFKDCADITSITVPASVTRIEGDVFSYCGAETITILGTVIVEYDAFFRSNIRTISINRLSDDLEYDEYAFNWEAVSDCEFLTTINYGGTVADWKAHVDHDNYSGYYLPTITVVCTDGTIEYIGGYYN